MLQLQLDYVTMHALSDWFVPEC